MAITEHLHKFEKELDELWLSAKNKLGLMDPLMVQVYNGFGSSKSIRLKGRVIERESVHGNQQEEKSLFRKIYNLYKRYESDEIPGVRVLVEFYGQKRIVLTDEDGFFNLNMQLNVPIPDDQQWHQVKCTLLDPMDDERDKVSNTGRVLIPDGQVEYGVISDVDDTILETHATDTFAKLQEMLLNSPAERKPNAGVPPFYTALQRGGDGNCFNPIFYITASAWNLYYLLQEFMAAHKIPEGPMLMQDKGLERNKLFTHDKIPYKLGHITEVLDHYPKLPFVLIGDSGQLDPVVYRKIVEAHREQIKAIYIRDVHPNRDDEHEQKVHELSEILQKEGVPVQLIQNTAEAAAHAANLGLVEKGVVGKIREQVEE